MRRLVALLLALAALLSLVAMPAGAASTDALAPQACDANYWPCIPPPPPDLNCADIRQRVWVIGPSDDHALDSDHDGIGCESYPVGPAGPPGGTTTTTTTPVPFVPPTTLPPPLCFRGTTATPPAATAAPAGLFTSITPVRVVDTRVTSALAAGESRTFTVTNASIPADASMVAMNVTAVDPTATGYLTVYPGGTNVPNVSNLNVTAGTTIANFVMARVSGGKVTVYNSAGCTHVLIDVVGYTRTDTGNGFTPISPARVKDTRTGLGGGGALGAGRTQTLSLAGIGGVPLAVDAVALNVTVVDPTATGYLTVSPTGTTRPEASNINFAAGATIANLVVAKLGTAGSIDLFNAAGDAHVLVDVFGYYASSGDTFVPIAPVRVFDVRNTGAFDGDERRDVQITGQAVPANATAVAINVTAVDPTATGYLTVFPSGQSQPGSSNLNFTAGRTMAGLAVVKLGAGGRLSIYNSAGRTGVLVDVAGYFSPTASGALPSLTVSAGGAPTAYVRAAFGDEWIDADADCHNTRAEVLMDESAAPVTFNPNGCTVNTGSWTDPWGGFTSTSAADFQIDHHVPLANAWRSGAWAWTDAQRVSFAQNLADPDALNATYGPLNTAKSDYSPDAWKPPLTSSWCRYATAWARLKHDWNLTVTSAELIALQQMTATC